MKLYRVQWTEKHDVEIWAKNATEAVELAYSSDVEKTIKNQSLDREPEVILDETETREDWAKNDEVA